MNIRDLGWFSEEPHHMASDNRFSDAIHRYYILPKPGGWYLSLIKGKEFHIHEYAWEGAVLDSSGINKRTPLTEGVEVFSSNEGTIEWIVKAYRWAFEGS